MNEIKYKNVDINSLEKFEIRKLKRFATNKINYISGTMCPVGKYDNILENINFGFSYYLKNGIKRVVLQPKFMGSRSQLYLFPKKLEDSFFVSRNGYKISFNEEFQKQYNIKELIEKIYEIYKDHLIWTCTELIIFDGELTPWRVLGKGLIDDKYRINCSLLEKELEFLQGSCFDKEMDQLLQEYDKSDFSKDKEELSKKQLIEKYGQNIYGKFKNISEIREFYVPTSNHFAPLENFKKQIEIYGCDKSIDYKPFDILKIVSTKHGEDSIFPLEGHERKWELLYGNKDDIVVVNTENVDHEFVNKKWIEYTQEKQFEGWVMKPAEIYQSGDEDSLIAHSLKIRNPDYLRIVYGYDYQFSHKYKRIYDKKKIKRKLETSIVEHCLGRKLLQHKYSNLNLENEKYVQDLANMMYQVKLEEFLDPRL